MPFDLDPPERVHDRSRLVDDERAPLDPPVRLAVHLLVLEHAVLSAHLAPGIAEKEKGQVVSCLEFPVGFEAVHVHTEDDRLEGSEPTDFVTEIERFPRSPRGIVFGIEVEDDLLPDVVLERNSGAVIGVERKGRRLLSGFGHRNFLPLPPAAPGTKVFPPRGPDGG